MLIKSKCRNFFFKHKSKIRHSKLSLYLSKHGKSEARTEFHSSLKVGKIKHVEWKTERKRLTYVCTLYLCTIWLSFSPSPSAFSHSHSIPFSLCFSHVLVLALVHIICKIFVYYIMRLIIVNKALSGDEHEMSIKSIEQANIRNVRKYEQHAIQRMINKLRTFLSLSSTGV